MNKTNMWDTVLWDLDGTIADTEELHFHAWQKALHPRGVDYDYDTFLRGFGSNNHSILTTLLGDRATPDLIADISTHKEQCFRQRMVEQPPRLLPGVMEWLTQLHSRGIGQVISSSAPMANITASLHVLEIADFFQGLVSGARLPRGKPDPTIFLNSAAAVATPPFRCLVIEDSLHGIEAARRAGMASIAVGKLASSSQLNKLLAEVAGPPCTPTAALSELQWERLMV